MSDVFYQEVLSSHCPMAYEQMSGVCPIFNDPTSYAQNFFISLSTNIMDDEEIIGKSWDLAMKGVPLWLYIDREVVDGVIHAASYLATNMIQIHINPQTFRNDILWLPHIASLITKCGVSMMFYISNIFPGVVSVSFILSIMERLKMTSNHRFHLDFMSIPYCEGDEDVFAYYLELGDIERKGDRWVVTDKYKRTMIDILTVYSRHQKDSKWTICCCER